MLSRAVAATLFFSSLAVGQAHAENCGREAFVAVVEKAKAELTAINTAQKQLFQSRLQLLKDRKSWSAGDYVAKATPFIQDERIAAFDEQNNALLSRVAKLGVQPKQSVASLAGAAPSFKRSPDERCAMVNSLKEIMAKVIGNARAKWAYMIGKVDAAIETAGKGGEAAQ